MRYIDAFNHFFPKRYYDALLETPAGAKDLGKRGMDGADAGAFRKIGAVLVERQILVFVDPLHGDPAQLAGGDHSRSRTGLTQP